MMTTKVKGRLFDTSEHEKVVVKILQGSADTQILLGGLTIIIIVFAKIL